MPVVALLLALTFPACIQERCYDTRDCPSARVCNASGACVECIERDQCGSGLECVANRCVPRELECDERHPCSVGFDCVANRCAPRVKQPITCPADMVSVEDDYCVDRFEASRPDATATSWGRDESRAVSKAGVMPWSVLDNATAEAACNATGKRLCTSEEWRTACKGPKGTVYAYGDSYEPAVCNGIDAFGRGGFHLVATGSFPGCTNGWGVFDMNGNLWEHVAGGSDMTIRGGAFNCSDSAALHKCDYVPGNWTPSARGFRCCLSPSAVDAGAMNADAAEDASAEDGGGCVSVGDAGQGDGAEADASVEETSLDADAGNPDVPVPVDVANGDEAMRVDVGTDGDGSLCSPEMAQVGEVCVDRWEASRSDATGTNAGKDENIAVSRAGVLPWYANPMSASMLGKFEAACQAGGKHLCTSEEWLDSCRGPGRSTYFFGDDWAPGICNSVDTYCQQCCERLGLASCPTGENCGYASELSSSYTPETCSITAEYGRGTCHVCFHVMPTGAFPKCTRQGLFDVNGNVWEVVTSPVSEDSRGYQVRGGAFNCGSPSARFQCDFDATWSDLYAGFRCCKAASVR
jgi:formylglycine-generating enzyme